MIGVLDLQNISYKNVDARGLITGFQFLQVIFRLFFVDIFVSKINANISSHASLLVESQSYYPERLAKCYILHMPWFFVSVWRLVSGFLDKATQEKVPIISKVT